MVVYFLRPRFGNCECAEMKHWTSLSVSLQNRCSICIPCTPLLSLIRNSPRNGRANNSNSAKEL